ncbi:hypothetical protein ARV1_gp07 [Acidianus rod-shaped virus 1]|uniref:Uncharacterized protein n=1 Tax=Acidianus rod-shaped virus 1 TaxID=309181 RepID=Q50I64_9VIRU|nr:hypothetical protein ARV1_gp07 [Acidianus rod-shaped virus 1]CAI44162.1 hypothetical protein [Acidianus rod-shaped virus 1]
MLKVSFYFFQFSVFTSLFFFRCLYIYSSTFFILSGSVFPTSPMNENHIVYLFLYLFIISL